MIQDNQTNKVFLSDQLEKKYHDTFLRLTAIFDEEGTNWDIIPGTRDIWARDYMPIQLDEKSFLAYRYEPDYLLDSRKHKTLITDTSSVCNLLSIDCKTADIILDGGNVTLCGNYIVMTNKIFRENKKQMSDAAFIRQLEEELGHKIIIIPWHCVDPTDEDADVYGHSDGFIHWCGGDKVLMSNHRDTDLQEASEIYRIMESYGFKITEMLFDVPHPEPLWNWAYINYLQVGKLIIVPVFGIEEDRQAINYITSTNPDCKVRTIRLRDIAAKGGALHCITWNIYCRNK